MRNPAAFRCRNREGMALAFALIFVVVMMAIVTAAVALTSTSGLISAYHVRQSFLEQAAAEALEDARAMLNADPGLYPDEGYVVLEAGAAVIDASGDTVPGVSRWVYAGPSGITSGEYGIYGSVVAVVRDGGSGVAIRRAQLFQESFARFAYFTDIEPSNIYFGGGDQIFGPLHSNDILKIHQTGATFHDEVRTAQYVSGDEYGDFRRGYSEGVMAIPMPQTQDLDKLREQAQAGGTYFDAPESGGLPTLRLEFMALDLDGDGTVTGANEGFFRAYTSNNTTWLLARRSSPMSDSRNCGHYHPDGTFVAAADHPAMDDWMASLTNSTRRCYLGGADSLWGAFVPQDALGQWVEWPGEVPDEVSGRSDADYLFPITRLLNPDFKGVIFVDGSVVISGIVRGRVTIAATGNIYIGDDLVYANDPSLQTCVDIVGLFSGNDVVVADNTINAPLQPGTGSNWVMYDDTKDEYIHAIILALDEFTVENYSGGTNNTAGCEGTPWGRGCLYLTGGVIQRTRGAVGQIVSQNPMRGTGYLKRYAYDRCGATQPPPYFPTTGHFFRGATYEVDPVGFDVAEYFDFLGS
ncbi:MAG TPA: pilus assembly PilX N-terminal domain-containing protein [Longimicrobiales bacterium]|nr:pilus assembly PilX N-terminal domain-containing protein [Longimicrobiales bacterium]